MPLKSVRVDKRIPSFYRLVVAVIFVAFFLIALWVFSSPSEHSQNILDEAISRAEDRITFDKQALSGESLIEKEEDALEPDDKDEGDLEPGTNGKSVQKSKTEAENPEEPDDFGEDVEANGNNEEKDNKDIENKVDLEHDAHDSNVKTSKSKLENPAKTDDTSANIRDDGSENKKVSNAENGSNKDESKLDDDFANVQESMNAVDEKLAYSSETSMTIRLPEVLPSVAQSELTTENKDILSSWITQAKESLKEKAATTSLHTEGEGAQKMGTNQAHELAGKGETSTLKETKNQDEHVAKLDKKDAYHWKLCKGGNATDYIPCLDNWGAISKLPTTKHYEHRERHCPLQEDSNLCLVPLPKGYKLPVHWPRSRDEVYFNNVPHPGLASYKKDQNWVKRSGEFLLFPGGGTQFKEGASHYIDYVEQVIPDIAWGKHTRVILDVGCGVASFGGFLYDKDVLVMSFAPKDEHEAQVQLALERGIPATSAVMGTQRLVFPSNVFDVAHCARCRVPWHLDGGKLLLEINRILRPGGYFIWSATPVYLQEEEDAKLWKETSYLAAAMCWNQLARTIDSSTGIGVAIFQKPTSNFCYEHRKIKKPTICDENDKPDAAWYIPMQNCIHKIPSEDGKRSSEWPQDWPQRVEATPSWLNYMPKGLYGKPAAEEFRSNTDHWKRVVEKSYLRGIGINWEAVRNVMDMNARYGGFAAALASLPVWVMNVVPTSEPDTLPIIFDRGLLGIYHDWCESFSTYPRTYDLLHADHLFSRSGRRCSDLSIVVEMDRILRPQGWVIFRDKVSTLSQMEPIIKSLQWDIRLSYSQETEQLVAAQKTMWRPASSNNVL